MNMKEFLKTCAWIGLLGLSTAALCGDNDLTKVATTVTTQATAVAKLLAGISYVTGVGFAMAGILQFKAHKENPQQVPLSKPVVMIIVAACLLFLPTVMTIAGSSIFGDGASSAGTAGGVAILNGQ